MIEPTKELQEYWDTLPVKLNLKKEFYERSDVFRKILNWLSTATFEELEWFNELCETETARRQAKNG